MTDKLKVGVIGATGMVGQRFVTLLANHPWFEISALAASGKSAGRTYEEAVRGRWKMAADIPDKCKKMKVLDASEVEKVASLVDFVFCAIALDKAATIALEEAYAKAETPVVSNNGSCRWIPDVPMIIPEINPSHMQLINDQKKRLGTKRGFIAVKPNCSIQSYVPPLTPLLCFEPEVVVATTYQAISGAGKNFADWPEMTDNVIPYIAGEEEKSEQEPLKIWGTYKNGAIEKAKAPLITTQCIRVPVTDGHTAAVFVKFKNKPTKEQILECWNSYKSPSPVLPGSPDKFITYFEEPDRPQVRIDRDIYNGMGICVGRLREDAFFDYKFVGLSHNTLRGAAGGAVLTAELLTNAGYITKKQ